MRPNKARYVTACQQLLALGAVIAVLAPAAEVISLDVVRIGPDSLLPGASQGIAEQPRLDRQAPAVPAKKKAAERKAPAVTEPVDAEVVEVPMAPAKAPAKAPRAAQEFVSAPEPVSGYGAVGVTWSPQTEVSDEDIEVLVRTRTADTWSDWQPVEYHDEHGPDPDTEEGRKARPGTDALLVGEVDEVQAKAITAAGVQPADMSLAVIGPGGEKTTEQAPAIDTGKLGSATSPAGGQAPAAETTSDSDQGAIALQAGTFTPKPQIYSRAQWGADESLRDKGSLRYFEVHAGFVHHTVNANNYSAEQVPGIIRSIYAYHTRTRGWSDVGYNFLVDRFGRIWEGRYGGVDRPVVGAHTQGYNEYSFAMSAIGNFETVQPTSVMLQAYAQLFAWKLSLHGVSAASPSQRVGSRSFPAINGHRDAGSTACPGRYLYAKIPGIRTAAAQLQADWSGRDRATNVVGGGDANVLLRRISDGAGYVLSTKGVPTVTIPGYRVTQTGWSGYNAAVISPDLTGDGIADMFVRRPGGVAGIRPGNGHGAFFPIWAKTTAFTGFTQIRAVGDLNRDGRNDMVAVRSGTLYLFRGMPNGTWSRVTLKTNWGIYNLTAGVGDFNGDGFRDIVSRGTAGALWLHRGTGRAALQPRTRIPGAWSGYDVITGMGDYTGDGRDDLFARVANGPGYVFPVRGNGVRGEPIGGFDAVRRIGFLASGGHVVDSAEPDLVGLVGDNLVVVPHGGFGLAGLVPVGAAFSGADAVLNVGDWDRDGFGDVITRQAGTGTMELRRGAPGGLNAGQVIGTGWGNITLLAAVGDMTGDGWPDLMGQPAGGALRIYPGAGPSGFGAPYVARSAVSASRQLGLGRWNGEDGAPDSAFQVGNALQWYAGNGPGGLTGGAGGVGVDLAPYDQVVSAGDVDGNGRPDLVVRERGTTTLWLLPGNFGGGFDGRRLLAAGLAGYDLLG